MSKKMAKLEVILFISFIFVFVLTNIIGILSEVKYGFQNYLFAFRLMYYSFIKSNPLGIIFLLMILVMFIFFLIYWFKRLKNEKRYFFAPIYVIYYVITIIFTIAYYNAFYSFNFVSIMFLIASLFAFLNSIQSIITMIISSDNGVKDATK